MSKRPFYLTKKKRLTKQRRKLFWEYALEVRDAMNLQAWDIWLSPNMFKDSDASAAIKPGNWTHRAVLQIGHEMFNPWTSRADIRSTMVHEMCHLIMQDYMNCIQDNMVFPKGLRLLANQRMERAMEKTVDDFARRIEELVPLPSRALFALVRG